MSGMQIYSQKMAQSVNDGQLSLKSSLNPGGKEYGSTIAFDSLIKDIQAKSRSSRTDQLFNAAEPRHRNNAAGHDDVKRKSGPADKQDKIHDREYHGVADRVREDAMRHDDVKAKEREPGTDDASGGPFRADKSIENRKDVYSQGPLQAEGPAEEGVEQADKVRAEALLLDLLNGESGISLMDALNNGLDASVEGEGVQNVNAQADGEGLMAGELINDLGGIQGNGMTESGLLENPMAADVSETGEFAGDNIKNGPLFSPVIKGSLSKLADSPEGGQSDNINGELLEGGAKSQESPKTDTSLFQSSDKQADDHRIPLDADGIEMQIQGENSETDDVAAPARDFSARSGNHGDAKKDHLQELKSLQDTAEANTQEAYKGIKDMSQKASPELAGSMNRESGMKQYTGDSGRPATANPETNTAGSMHSSGITREAGKSPEMPQSGAMTRPSAFSEIADKIIYMAKGQHRLGVTVENETLGKLNISLSLEKGMVNVHIQAADRVVREFVENNIQQIVESLSKNGVSVGGVSVGLNNYRNSESNWSREGGSRRNDRLFSIDGIQKKKYMHTGAYGTAGNGRVNIFA